MYIRSHVSEIHYNYNVAQYVANNRFYHIQECIYNHRTTKTNQKYPSVNL